MPRIVLDLADQLGLSIRKAFKTRPGVSCSVRFDWIGEATWVFKLSASHYLDGSQIPNLEACQDALPPEASKILEGSFKEIVWTFREGYDGGVELKVSCKPGQKMLLISWYHDYQSPCAGALLEEEVDDYWGDV